MNNSLLLRNIFPNNTNINFVRLKYLTLITASVLIIASFLSLYIKSLNFGIDFTGGIVFEVRFPEKTTVSQVRKIFDSLKTEEVIIQTLENSSDMLIKVAVKNEAKQGDYIKSIKEVLSSKISKDIEFRKVEFIGAEVGNEMISKGIIAISLTFLGIIAYVWIRFNWQYSVGVVVGLLHDVILTIGFLTIARFEFNITSVAAILTILGYSVNDTVVIYDRIREKMRTSLRTDIDTILNKSINETLSRTLLTAITTLLAALILILFGGETLKSFSITVFVGIVIGTYSSIFISVPLLQVLHKKTH